MDNSNWRPTPPSGEPTMDTGDWRTQLQADSRQRIVNKITDTLKRHLPFSGQEGLNELRKIAVRFEEKIFTAASSQSDYLRRISLKMLTMETKCQNTIPNTGTNSKPPDPGSQAMQNQVHSQGQSIPIPLQSNQSQTRQQLLPQNVPNNMTSAGVQSSAGLQYGMPPVSGLTQNPIPNVVGQNSNMQNMSGTMQNSLGQGMPSNIFANQQRQMQGRQQVHPQQQQQQQQQLYHQQLQHQLMTQQGNLQLSLMQSHMQQQQQQNLLPPTQLQSGMQTSSTMQPSAMQSTPLPGLQQNQQSSLQQSTQSMLQQHQQSVLRQQQQPQQAASAGIHQQQTPMTQQSMMPQQHQQPPQPQPQQHQQPHVMGQQTNDANIQQTQLIGQQNSIGDMQQQRLLGHPNNLSNLQQQQQQQQLMAQQNNLSNIHQQQLIGTKSGNSSMQTNQQSLHMLSQAKVPLQQTQQSAPSLLPTQGQTSQQPPLQQHRQLMLQMQSQSTQLQQQLGLQQQPNQFQRDMQQRLQASSPLLQSQNLIDQLKQLYQLQRAVPETSSTSLDFTAQTGHANGGDWQEEVYQKIKTMKETYLPELNEMYQKIAAKLQQHDSLPQQPKSDQLEQLKLFKTMLERIITFLTVSKANILPTFKDKLTSYEKQIINFINTNRPRKPASTLQQGQLPPPHMHSMQQPQPQINQTQSHDNQMNPQLESINIQGSVPTMQTNNTTSLQHNSLSSLPGVSTAQQTMLNSLQPGSNLDSGQGNALGSMQQVAPGPLQQNPVSTYQQANISSLSSQSGISVLQQNMNPLQSNSSMLQHQHLKQQELQMLQSQQLKQQYQQRQMQQQPYIQKLQLLQQQQAKQQLPTQLQTHQMPQLHQMNDVNDMKMRQGMGFKPGVFQQHLPAGQRQSYTHEQLKQGSQFPFSSPHLLQAASPQMPQHSSPQVDQQSLLTSISKTGTPFQSANSPFVVPSPSTPLAPSPMLGESEKAVPATSSLSNAANVGHQQETGVQPGSQALVLKLKHALTLTFCFTVYFALLYWLLRVLY
ncbi:Uncharacterized protein TCM_027316 [Theobroma cacao]|uniref:Mediator complex subunit 15 KIX domain-containing protein n=1 Tax=Theobroma cacao TaxID=3641 RepID=A0A061G947_THECC|nr:Uncharacterized protein TCM_027316 [Theobroma cacao]